MLRIKEFRDAHELTQEALAYRAGVSVRTVYRAEHRGTASMQTLQLLARALDVTVDDLFPEPEGVAS
jgi:transcriptional regulator with XRE-family HTH domain